MARLWFGVLGPVLVREDGAVLEITAARQRALLAVLLLRAPAPVPSEDLVATLWPGDRPEHTDNALHVQISRLRRSLGPDAGARVQTCATGYRIRVEHGESDLEPFHTLSAAAQRAAADAAWPRARSAADGALRLWRGDPGQEVAASAHLAAEVTALRELHDAVKGIRMTAMAQLVMRGAAGTTRRGAARRQ